MENIAVRNIPFQFGI